MLSRVGEVRTAEMAACSVVQTYCQNMHPPALQAPHHLSDWSECRLELDCCRGQVAIPRPHAVAPTRRRHSPPHPAAVSALQGQGHLPRFSLYEGS